MRMPFAKKFNCLLLTGFLLSLILGCAKKEAGKIPITTNSKEAKRLFIEGRNLADRLQVQESKTYFEKALEKDPDFAMANLYLSFAQPTARQFFQALDKAKALVDRISEGEKLWILGFEAGINGLPMKQREYYQKLVELYPDDEYSHNLLGLNYFYQQEYEASIKEFQKAIEIAPKFSQPYNQMGYAYRFMNQFSEAEKAFKKYIELIPKDPNPYDSYAELLLKMGNYSKSIENYNKALEQNPNFVASYLGIATDYNLMGEYEKARTTLQKLMEISRNKNEKLTALFAISVSFIYEGNYEKALEIQNQRLEMNKIENDEAEISSTLETTGMILLEQGKADEALKRFNEALDVILKSDLPREIKDRIKRIYIYDCARADLVRKDFKSARVKADEFFTAVQEIKDANQIRQTHELLGMIALYEKNFDRAIEELGQASQINPYNLYRLASAYAVKGDREKAKEYLHQVVNFNSLNDINLAFCRNQAEKMLESLK